MAKQTDGCLAFLRLVNRSIHRRARDKNKIDYWVLTLNQNGRRLNEKKTKNKNNNKTTKKQEEKKKKKKKKKKKLRALCSITVYSLIL